MLYLDFCTCQCLKCIVEHSKEDKTTSKHLTSTTFIYMLNSVKLHVASLCVTRHSVKVYVTFSDSSRTVHTFGSHCTAKTNPNAITLVLNFRSVIYKIFMTLCGLNNIVFFVSPTFLTNFLSYWFNQSLVNNNLSLLILYLVLNTH